MNCSCAIKGWLKICLLWERVNDRFTIYLGELHCIKGSSYLDFLVLFLVQISIKSQIKNHFLDKQKQLCFKTKLIKIKWFFLKTSKTIRRSGKKNTLVFRSDIRLFSFPYWQIILHVPSENSLYFDSLSLKTTQYVLLV